VWTDSLGVIISDVEEVEYSGPGEITLTVFDRFGCIVEESYFIDFMSSTDDPELSDYIDIYPNPAMEYLTLSLPEGATRLTIFSSDGKLVYNRKLNSQKKLTLQLHEYDQGVFTAKVEIGEKFAVKQFIKL